MKLLLCHGNGSMAFVWLVAVQTHVNCETVGLVALKILVTVVFLLEVMTFCNIRCGP